jgi:hypothetical protein
MKAKCRLCGRVLESESFYHFAFHVQGEHLWELVDKEMAERIMNTYFETDQEEKDRLYESLKRFEKARKILEGTERE